MQKQRKFEKHQSPPKQLCAREQERPEEQLQEQMLLGVSKSYVASYIKNHLQNWKAITSDKVIIDIVKNALFESEPVK